MIRSTRPSPSPGLPGTSPPTPSDEAFGLALWGCLTVIVFVAAYASWQFRPPSMAGVEIARLRLPAGNPTETTASLRPAEYPGRTSEPVGTAPANAETKRALAELAREQSDLIRRVKSLEEKIAPSAAPLAPPPELSAPAARPNPGTAAQASPGVDLGGFRNLTALRTAWADMQKRLGEAAAGLAALAAANETGDGIELRLIAGPLPNAEAAARLCAKAKAAGLACAAASFQGQPIAAR